VGVFESEEIIERTTSVVGLGMVMIVALQLDFSKEGVDAAGAVVIAGFKGQGRFIVGQQGAVVVEAGDDFQTVGEESFAQAVLDPFGAFARTRSAQGCFGFRDEGLGFGEFFFDCFCAEFFLHSPFPAPGVWLARRVRV
jgi:hypothetical protein